MCAACGVAEQDGVILTDVCIILSTTFTSMKVGLNSSSSVTCDMIQQQHKLYVIKLHVGFTAD